MRRTGTAFMVVILTFAVMGDGFDAGVGLAMAQTVPPVQAAATSADVSQPTPAADLEMLVARIALYPDDLVALVLSASLNPLQIVEAGRYLDDVKKTPSLKPNSVWDGSVISLLNYPEIVTMMSGDLGWTQNIGQAVVAQQKDVLVAIQQLRDQALAHGIIITNDQVVVEKKDDNVIIRPVKKEVIYVPQYDPTILTNPTYIAQPQPVSYGHAYPSYYFPYAPYWAGFVTGAAFGAAVDWGRWHSWGGDVDVNINNIRRDDFHFDRNNLNNLNFDARKFGFDHDTIAKGIQLNGTNRLDLRGGNSIASNAGLISASSNRIRSGDVRRDVQSGLANRSGGRIGGNGRAQQIRDRQPGGGLSKAGGAVQAARSNRPPRAAGRVDHRSRQPSAIGNYGPGRDARAASARGRESRQLGGGRFHRRGGVNAGGGFHGNSVRFHRR